MSEEIQVVDGDEKSYNISLSPNKRVSMSSLRVAVPHASGLVYYDDKGVHILAIDNDEIIIDPLIKSYVVRYNEGIEYYLHVKFFILYLITYI